MRRNSGRGRNLLENKGLIHLWEINDYWEGAMSDIIFE